jgi:hypothetical protein
LSTSAIATDIVGATGDGRFAAVWANLERKSVIEVGDMLEIIIKDIDGSIVAGPIIHKVTVNEIEKAFANIKLLLGDDVIPRKSALFQNYPNPFNPETWIPFKLAEGGKVTITIYDVHGRLVRTFSLGYVPAGVYQTKAKAAYWDGRNEAGERVASGVCFYNLQSGKFSATRKMVILK